MSEEKRYSVGIDLGTTNSVVSWVDLSQCDREKAPVEVAGIPQLIAPGEVEERGQLPSFEYLPHPDELGAEDRVLPWRENVDHIVGVLAREMGSKTPIRLVASAKSWLCHAGVNPKDAFLPIEAPEEVPRTSPYQASLEYLQHLRDAWNHQHPDSPLEQQDLVITVPASFDPAARELTAEAAREAGLSQAILLEEPQAALYSWIQRTEGQWREQVQVGDIILVVDVGGGTTDLSLIAVTEEDGNLQLNRVAVGDHILLGGDNMDLALAYVVKMKLEQEGKPLDPWQVQALTHSCRGAKEQLLADPDLAQAPVVVPSRGSKLIGGTLRAELTREEVNRTLIDGFFPQVEVTEKPISRPRTGLTTLGLPYAQDARITAHLAHFLSRQVSAVDELEGVDLPENARFIHPSAVLLNGGVFKPQLLSDRLLAVVNQWLTADDAPAARLLEGADLDLAVARGGSYYGYVRMGGGVRIRGGTAAAYYIGVESAMPAVPGFPPPIRLLCVAPFGMEEGTEAPLPPHEFGVVVGEPVRFRFFNSTIRREDPVGALLDHWTDEEVQELAEIEVTLSPENHQPGEVVPVQLAALYTEVGTLRLEAVAKDTGERWKVEFEVRGQESTQSQAEESSSTRETSESLEETSESESPEPTSESTPETEAEATESAEEPGAPEGESSEQEQKPSFWPFKK
ncbi:Hsp70 family protein [Methylohalobius crimeensis]|uniref:Hsp70 family protein n=1 Tax=Methylohalobius crimeensis TaxID=244365 RepID=UPI0003B57502|nr:Hsp70 family protein [Methylohalobius crimeensis]